MSILHGDELPKIVERMPLEEYAPELAQESLFVWLNPPRDVRQHFYDIERDMVAAGNELVELKKTETGEPSLQDAPRSVQAQALQSRIDKALLERDAWLSTVWSQGAAGTGISAEEVTKLRISTSDQDPQLFLWLARKALTMMDRHRTDLKKV